ncbi:MAG: hypothetical protein JWN47_876, partial [Frankiales bacterium]|nr:hypothetical protein [Frankiales bacterium]
MEYDSGPVMGQSADVQLEQLLPSLVAGLPDLLDDLEKLLLDLAPSYSNFIAARRNVVLAAAEAGVRSLVSVATQIWSDTTQQENVWQQSVDQTLFEE